MFNSDEPALERLTLMEISQREYVLMPDEYLTTQLPQCVAHQFNKELNAKHNKALWTGKCGHQRKVFARSAAETKNSKILAKAKELGYLGYLQTCGIELVQ